MSGELEKAKVKWRTDAGSSPVSVMADLINFGQPS